MSGLHLSQRYKDWLFIQGDEQESDTSGDLISRQAVIEGLNTINGTAELDKAFEVIERIPPVNPQEPKTGHWIEIAQYSDGKHKVECSECKSHIFDRGHANSFNVKNKYKYCPNCGCRMLEPQESEDEE